MKKLISLIATVAMVSTLFVSVAKADVSPVVSTEVSRVDDDTFFDYMDEHIPDGYDVYQLNVTLSGLGNLSCKKSAGKLNGTMLFGAGYVLQFDSETIDLVDPDFTQCTDKAFSNGTEGVDTDKYTYQINYATGDPSVAYPAQGVELADATIEDAFVIWVIVANSATVEATISSNITIAPVSKGTPGTETVYYPTPSPSKVTFAPEAAPPVTQYTYTFKSEDGTSDIASVTLDAGAAVTAPTDPTKEGWTFQGWAKSIGGSVVAVDATATDNTTYFAIFEKNPVNVASVSLDKAELTFTVGGAAQTLEETVLPGDADDKSVVWTSDDETVATVADGVVTPVGAGKATITVTTTDGGKTATCTVKVNPAPVASTGFKEIAKETSLSDLTGKPVDASKNYGVGRIETEVDTSKFVYKVVASDGTEEKEFDLPSGLEVAGNINFIAIVQSATHIIKSILLKAVVK